MSFGFALLRAGSGAGRPNRLIDPTSALIGHRSVSVGRAAYSWLLERLWRNLA
jgi:hypothetical protein